MNAQNIFATGMVLLLALGLIVFVAFVCACWAGRHAPTHIDSINVEAALERYGRSEPKGGGNPVFLKDKFPILCPFCGAFMGYYSAPKEPAWHSICDPCSSKQIDKFITEKMGPLPECELKEQAQATGLQCIICGGLVQCINPLSDSVICRACASKPQSQLSNLKSQIP